MNERFLSVVFVIVLALSGCQTASKHLTYEPKTPYSETNFDWSLASGTGAIEGQAFLKTQGGDVKYAAGNEVVLVPFTDYTAELFEAAMLGIYSDLNTDPRYTRHRRTTIADGEGRFGFDYLPAGEWFVMTTVNWLAPGYGRQGGSGRKAGFSRSRTGHKNYRDTLNLQLALLSAFKSNFFGQLIDD